MATSREPQCSGCQPVLVHVGTAPNPSLNTPPLPHLFSSHVRGNYTRHFNLQQLCDTVVKWTGGVLCCVISIKGYNDVNMNVDMSVTVLLFYFIFCLQVSNGHAITM